MHARVQFHAQRVAVMELAHVARRLRRSLVEPLFVVQAPHLPRNHSTFTHGIDLYTFQTTAWPSHPVSRGIHVMTSAIQRAETAALPASCMPGFHV